MTAELGMNLAGVERVFELEEQLERTRKRMAALEREAEALRGEMAEEIERVKRQFRAEIVPYRAGGLVRSRDAGPPRPRG